MWDEDPRCLQAIYRFLIWAVAVGLGGGFVLSLCSGDWQPYRVFLETLGGFLTVVCVYALVIWIVGHLSLKLSRVLKKFWHKHGDSQTKL